MGSGPDEACERRWAGAEGAGARSCLQPTDEALLGTRQEGSSSVGYRWPRPASPSACVRRCFLKTGSRPSHTSLPQGGTGSGVTGSQLPPS